MAVDGPLQVSQGLIAAMGTRMFVCYEERIPTDGRVLVISNHRSFMDVPILMAATRRSIRFACHYYMSQVPVLREIVTAMGAFPLEPHNQRQGHCLHRAREILQAGEWVGIFPEGGQAMVKLTSPLEVGNFHRGFAHLAFQAEVENLAILPSAIASSEEVVFQPIPLRLLSFFDPSEPLFQQEGWHPVVIYKQVKVLFGRPFWITPSQRKAYSGKLAKAVVADLLSQCRAEIADLLNQGRN
ncbi:MAG: 1-acyl-sn-glycerol-3-phosphate acyltransferase [Oscillatoriaceae bacterium SKW80]|nr:1-acyl-sn-glycerol-3-phosphate acyltransferase [Oscillatoriaceae bacterium SKYG93]MCX8119777.1 1-acyl-sn-glycerol-3-phosphate acyltransferase [Oscillatoriaceae bacterium SKW80]HIK27681.1 1-acyl-sn-glycerol-3-phosphate acyltransferase [Oscillatoriaceae cyanobacterium M7585_C2015_266]